ncbi:DUF742 domain-containing protein [Streptomyces sp. NPDC003660]
MNEHDSLPPDSPFVRTYVLVDGRTQPRHLLAVDTVLAAGQGRLGPHRPEECRQIVALCRAHPRSVAELAGHLERPVSAVKVLVSDLVDADALVLPLTNPYSATDDADDRPSLQLLTALSAGLRRKFPDAISYATYAQAG